MRVLWVEDFGKADPETLIGKLFSFAGNDRFAEVLGIAAQAIRRHEIIGSDDEWEDIYSEIGPSKHEIHPVVHETQLNAILKSGCLREHYDLALIDVDLSEGFFLTPSTAVELGKEGQWVYQKLHHEGLLPKNLAFLTANKDKVPIIEKELRRSLHIDNVIAFGKDETGRLDHWLKERDSPYMRLRRGVLDGVKFGQRFVERGLNELGFPPGNPFARNDLLDYLDGIRIRFRERELSPADQTTLSRFLNDIAAPWERARQPKADESIVQRATRYTLKNTRNWCAHHRLKDVTPEDIAVIFVINMRAVCDGENHPFRPYENILFDLFCTQSVEIEEAMLSQAFTDKYRNLWHELDAKIARGEKNGEGKPFSWVKPKKSGDEVEKHYRYFNELSNLLVESANEGAHRLLLVQNFWISLGKMRGKDSETTISFAFLTDAGWCNRLLRASYSHCFPRAK